MRRIACKPAFPRMFPVMLLMALGSPAGHALSYAPAATYAVGSPSPFVAVADFNGDGSPDLAVSNSFAGSVSILLNNRDGTFGAAVPFAVGSNPFGIAAGDFDGDGDLDLAVANGVSDTVSILLNNGTGAFAPAIPYAVGAGPTNVAAGDLDGDGDIDLVVASRVTQVVSILRNDGDGTFAPRVDYAAGGGPVSVAIGDLNSDGFPDLAVSNANSDNVSILLNIRNGTFAPKVDFPVGRGPTWVAIGDFNADGNPDLAVSNTDSDNVSILINAGNGTFAAASPYPVGDFPAHVAIADLDADGRPDLAVANLFGNSISIGLGNGDGTFQPAITLATGAGTLPSSVETGDLDGDGAPDLAIAPQGTDRTFIFRAITAVPGAPTIGMATAGNAQLSVAFTAPATNGGSRILDYTATCGGRSATGATSPIVVTGLTNGTALSCTVVARNGVGTGASSAPSNIAIPVSRSYTGASATGSGIITASFTGGGPGCTYVNSRFIALAGDATSPPAGSAPAGIVFPHGLFEFTTSGCTPGSTLAMTISYPVPMPPGTQYWKYGPTPSSATPHWYVLPATIVGVTATFTITDGALGDDDLSANGTFVDQGGPAFGNAIPTLSGWALMLMALLVMLAGTSAVSAGRPGTPIARRARQI